MRKSLIPRRYASCAPLLAAVLMTLLAVVCLSVAAADDPPQAPRVEVGQEAPAFSLVASDGETYALSEVRDQKALILVFFRGSW